MSFDPGLWTRLEHDRIPIWVRPDRPSWLVPNRAGDTVLRRLAEAEAPALDMKERRFLARLPDDPPRRYTGRYHLLRTDYLREIWFHLTDNCNMTCGHCLVSSSPQARAMIPAARVAEIAGQARRLGCRVFALTGGEPFVHPQFETIVDDLLVHDDSRVVVLTNGSLLRHHEAALDRWPADRFHLQISVDGLPRSHDDLRGERSFEALVRQLRLLESRGTPFTVSMCVMEQNREEMADVVDFAADIGATNVHFLWYLVRGRGTAESAAVPAGLFEALRSAAARARIRGVTIDNVEACRAQVFAPSGTIHDGSNSGWESVAMSPDGRLYPSPALVGVPALGTPVDGDLARAWRESPVLESLRRATNADQDSPLRHLVGGGDSDHSFVHAGRFLGDDPYLPLHENLALWLIAAEAAEQPDEGPPALRLKMGDVLAACGDGRAVALTHSNCLLAVASRDEVRHVKEFYTEAARSPAEEIRNPVCYPPETIAHIPGECLVRSYGCGSPVLDARIRTGERVVDLGSGTGVECMIASRLVGEHGSVVGIDMLPPMIDLARRGVTAAAANLGYSNVEFRQAYLEKLPLESSSVDVVLSNCVINLSSHKRRTFAEIHRVLAPGGRLVVSDVACETEPNSQIRNDERLHGECIAGALTQRDLVGLLEETGFSFVRVLSRFPYRVVQGHPFFSLTFEAGKAPDAPRRRVLYRGPFAAALGADGTLLTPGTIGSVSLPSAVDEAAQLFELDPAGRVTNVDLGTSSCCSPAPAQLETCCDPPAAQSETCRDSPAAQDAVVAGSSPCCGSRAEGESPSPRRLPAGCMRCGAALVYAAAEREMTCEFCAARTQSTARCEQGHFVCDGCHSEESRALIERICLGTEETDTLSLLRKIRSHPTFPLHGPEHHSLVPAVILSTYGNLGGNVSAEQIRLGIRRGAQVPGGSCGTLGACGAAVGVGIAFGVILESTPLTARPRSHALEATAAVLTEIAALTAPRCCLRECVLALQVAARLSRRLLPVTLRADGSFACGQPELNDECVGSACPIYPLDESPTAAAT